MRAITAAVLITAGCELLTAQGPVAPVVVAPITEREVRPTRLFVGDVRPTREVLVGTDVEGRVIDYPIDEGMSVRAGDVLAGLRHDQLAFELEAARAELRTLEAQLEELRNGTRPEEIAQAEARLAAAKAEEDLRKWQLDKAEELYRTETVAEDQLREAQWNAAVATARRTEAEEALDLAREGPREEVKAQAAGRVAAQRARVARLEDELARHVIKAPFDGSIVEERTELGAWLRQGDPVTRIVALDTVDVELPVPEDFVTGLSLGQKVRVRLPALGGAEFEGEIHAITPLANLRARTFPVRIRIENPFDDGVPRLKAGMFAQARLPTGVPQRALTVPKDALVLGGDRAMVYVVGDDSLVRALAVETGEAVDGDIVVRGPDLAPGMRVVVRGNERLRPGQPVRVTDRLPDDADANGR